MRIAPGFDAELAAQDSVQTLELPQRRMAVATRGVAPHHRDVRGFVARIDLENVLPATRQPQQVEMPELELLPPLLGPDLVPVLGQQLTAIQRQRFSGGGSVVLRDRAASE